MRWKTQNNLPAMESSERYSQFNTNLTKSSLFFVKLLNPVISCSWKSENSQSRWQSKFCFFLIQKWIMSFFYKQEVNSSSQMKTHRRCEGVGSCAVLLRLCGATFHCLPFYFVFPSYLVHFEERTWSRPRLFHSLFFFCTSLLFHFIGAVSQPLTDGRCWVMRRRRHVRRPPHPPPPTSPHPSHCRRCALRRWRDADRLVLWRLNQLLWRRARQFSYFSPTLVPSQKSPIHAAVVCMLQVKSVHFFVHLDQIFFKGPAWLV